MIGWLLRRWQKRSPGPALFATLVFLIAGILVLCWWVLTDLTRGRLMRPAIAVLALAFLAIRVIASFRPYRR